MSKLKAKPISGPVVVEDSIQKIAGVPVHPDAAWFPMMSDADLDTFAANIKMRGVGDPVEYMRGKDGVLRMLDGRNRVRASELIAKAEGRELERAANGLPKVQQVIIDERDIRDTLAYVVSRNLHRRHLKDDQRNDVIRSISAQYPDFSIRRLADVTGVSKSAVHRAVQQEPVNLEPVNPEPIKPDPAASGAPDGTPAPQPKPEPDPQPKPESKRVIGKDGKSYSKKQPAKSKPAGPKPAANAGKLLTRDQAVVAIGAELTKKPRETIDDFIKLIDDARRATLKLPESARFQIVINFAAALGFGAADLLLHLETKPMPQQESAA